MKIANIADLHISPETMQDAERSLQWALKDMRERGVSLVNIAGDVFNAPVVGDSDIATGPLYDMVAGLLANCEGMTFNVLPGNHDIGKPNQPAAAAPLGNLTNVHYYPIPRIVRASSVDIVMMPWLTKANIFSNGDTKGMNQEEIAHAFNQRVNVILEDLVNRREGVHLMLVGHAEVTGALLGNDTRACAGKEFPLPKDLLDRFDHVALGHLHKRQRYYVGSLFENNFGEAGYEVGYEVVNVHPDRLEVEHVTNPHTPRHRTISKATCEEDLPDPKSIGPLDRLKVWLAPEFPNDSKKIWALGERGAIVKRLAERSTQLRTDERLDEGEVIDPHKVLEYWARHNGIAPESLPPLTCALDELLGKDDQLKEVA